MGVYEGFKDVIRMVQQIDNIELYRKILELQAQSLEISSALVAKEKEIAGLTSEIDNLKETLKKSATITSHENLYFDIDETGRPVGYAYCPRCYDVDAVLVHIVQNPKKRSTSYCPQCKNEYLWWRRLDPENDS